MCQTLTRVILNLGAGNEVHALSVLWFKARNGPARTWRGGKHAWAKFYFYLFQTELKLSANYFHAFNDFLHFLSKQFDFRHKSRAQLHFNNRLISCVTILYQQNWNVSWELESLSFLHASLVFDLSLIVDWLPENSLSDWFKEAAFDFLNLFTRLSWKFLHRSINLLNPTCSNSQPNTPISSPLNSKVSKK